MNIFEHML